MPFFSIIIPTYNRASFIQKSIATFLNQSFTDFELIIVDDGSTDNTEQKVKTIDDNRIHYYKINNSERGVARNFGITKAKGTYINFFDSDDWALPNHLQEAYSYIQKTNTAFFNTLYEIRNEKLELLIHPKGQNEIGIHKLVLTNKLNCGSVFIEKKLLEETSFSENRSLSGSEDWLLWLKLAARNGFKTIDVVTNYLIQHDNRSMSNFNGQQILMRKEIVLNELSSDKLFLTKYKPLLLEIEAEMDSLAALHFAITKNKMLSIKYFAKAVTTKFKSIYSRRTLAIIKYLLLGFK